MIYYFVVQLSGQNRNYSFSLEGTGNFEEDDDEDEDDEDDVPDGKFGLGVLGLESLAMILTWTLCISFTCF